MHTFGKNKTCPCLCDILLLHLLAHTLLPKYTDIGKHDIKYNKTDTQHHFWRQEAGMLFFTVSQTHPRLSGDWTSAASFARTRRAPPSRPFNVGLQFRAADAYIDQGGN